MIGELIRKLIAAPFGNSKIPPDTTTAAMASVAESLLSAKKSALVGDIRKIKKAHLKKLKAQADSESAEAQQKLVAAQEAANKVTGIRHSLVMQRRKEEAAKLANLKLRADAELAQAHADKAKIAVANDKLALFRKVLENRKGGPRSQSRPRQRTTPSGTGPFQSGRWHFAYRRNATKSSGRSDEHASLQYRQCGKQMRPNRIRPS